MAAMRLFIAGKVLISHNNKVLIIRESSAYREGTQTGNFDVVGGRLRPGENFKEAVIREVKEETGLDVLLGLPLFVSDIRQVISGEQCQVIRVYFEGSSLTDKVTLSRDHSDYEWIDPRDYGKYPIIGNMVPVFQAYLALKGIGTPGKPS